MRPERGGGASDPDAAVVFEASSPSSGRMDRIVKLREVPVADLHEGVEFTPSGDAAAER